MGNGYKNPAILVTIYLDAATLELALLEGFDPLRHRPMTRG